MRNARARRLTPMLALLLLLPCAGAAGAAGVVYNRQSSLFVFVGE